MEIKLEQLMRCVVTFVTFIYTDLHMKVFPHHKTSESDCSVVDPAMRPHHVHDTNTLSPNDMHILTA